MGFGLGVVEQESESCFIRLGGDCGFIDALLQLEKSGFEFLYVIVNGSAVVYRER